MTEQHDDIDWSLTTWEGSRREQLRRWCRLTLRERFRALEEMGDIARQFADMRAQGHFQGLGKLSASSSVHEQRGEYAPVNNKKSTPDK